MSIQFSYYSDLFERFRNISENDVYGVIRFYENHEEELALMPFEERFTILCYYTNALFAAEESRRHLEYAQAVLEGSILERIQYVDGHDIYLHTLYQKAISHIRLKEFEQAVKISKQLLFIAPGNQKKWGALFMRSLLLQRPLWVRKAFGWGMLAMIVWTSLELLRMLVLEPFYPMINNIAVFVQFSSLIFAIMMSLTAILGHYFFVSRIYRAAQREKSCVREPGEV